MQLDNQDRNRIKKIAEEFTSQAFGIGIPDGLCFSTCFPLSILFDIKQINNLISCGSYPKNEGTIPHIWLTLDDEDTILDATIRQFDESMESVYVGKLRENRVTRKYVPGKSNFEEWFNSSYDVWAEPLIDRQPRTFQRPRGFEDKMNLLNIKAATILYSHIEKMSSKDRFILTSKCKRYFSPIFKFLRDKSETDKNFIDSCTNPMLKDFNLLLTKALNNS